MELFNVFPCLSLNHSNSYASGNTEFPHNFVLRPSVQTFLSNSLHNFFVQFVILTSGAKRMTAAQSAFSHVFSVRAQFHVSRIDAYWGIALVKYFQAFRNVSMRQTPRNAMRVMSAAFGWCRWHMKDSVAFPRQMGCPEPACFRFIHFQPETFRKSKISFSHAILSRSLVRGAAGIQALPRFAIIA